MGEVEGFVNHSHLFIDCYNLQANVVLPEILLMFIYRSLHLSSLVT